MAPSSGWLAQWRTPTLQNLPRHAHALRLPQSRRQPLPMLSWAPAQPSPSASALAASTSPPVPTSMRIAAATAAPCRASTPASAHSSAAKSSGVSASECRSHLQCGRAVAVTHWYTEHMWWGLQRRGCSEESAGWRVQAGPPGHQERPLRRGGEPARAPRSLTRTGHAGAASRQAPGPACSGMERRRRDHASGPAAGCGSDAPRQGGGKEPRGRLAGQAQCRLPPCFHRSCWTMTSCRHASSSTAEHVPLFPTAHRISSRRGAGPRAGGGTLVHQSLTCDTIAWVTGCFSCGCSETGAGVAGQD